MDGNGANSFIDMISRKRAQFDTTRLYGYNSKLGVSSIKAVWAVFIAITLCYIQAVRKLIK